MGATFRNVSPEDLQTHLRFIASGALPSQRAELLLGTPAIEVPVLHQRLQRQPDRLTIALRSGSIGRSALDEIVESIQSSGQPYKVRRSAKLKIVSQCLPYWSVTDSDFSSTVIGVLSKLWGILEREWPPEVTVTYAEFDLKESLPGVRDPDRAWEAGRAIGRAVRRILRGQRGAA